MTPTLPLCLLLLAACGSRATLTAALTGDAPPVCDAELALDHPWQPLHPGSGWSYAGEVDGRAVHEDITVAPRFVTVDGVRCVLLVEQRFDDDSWFETTEHWLSGDRDGGLWLFGERTLHRDAPGTATADSWLAGVDGVAPVLWLPAAPATGDTWLLDLPHGTESMTVLSTQGKVDVPAGVFAGCLAIEEANSEELDLVLYAPGVGRVIESAPGTTLRLVERR